MKNNKNLVVGAGFSGAVIAERIATQLGEEVLLIDKKNHIAGNSFDYKDKNGITIHKYGSHIFHTSSDKVWKYLSCFAEFNDYVHKVVVNIDGRETTIPFNLNTIYDVFDEGLAKKLEAKLLEKYDYNSKVPILEFQKQNDENLKFLAHFIYDKVFLNYTKKQWGEAPDEIDGAVTARVPVYVSRDDSYFQDKYQGIPTQGYTKLVENILSDEKIEVRLNTDYKNLKDKSGFKRIFYTGSIDEFFDYKFGILPYRSVHFEIEEHNKEYYQSNAVINYPNDNNFTRVHEYKYYLNDKSQNTVVAKEFSEFFELGKNDRYYPIFKEENLNLYNKYLQEVKEIGNIFFLGRLGDYKYYDMDKAILRALEVFESIC